MLAKRKEEAVKQIEGWLSRCNIAIITDYRRMPVAEMNQLRRRLKESGAEYHVVKNTLTHLAADRAGKEGLKAFLQGPSAIALGYGEVTEPAKILVDFARSAKVAPIIKGGLMNKRVLYPEDIKFLASLPPKEVLIPQVLQRMQAPLMGLVTVLSANLRGIITIIERRKQQLEGG